jgi:hypothetical protein
VSYKSNTSNSGIVDTSDCKLVCGIVPVYFAYHNMSLYVNASYIVNHSHEHPGDTKETMPFATGSVNRGDLVFTYLYDTNPNKPARKPHRKVGGNGLLSKVFTSMPHKNNLNGQIRVAGIANSASTIALGRDLEASIQITGQCQLRTTSLRTKVQVGDALYINAFVPPTRDYTKGEDGVPHYVPVVYAVPSVSDSLEKMLSDGVATYTDWYALHRVNLNDLDQEAREKAQARFFESRVKPHLLQPITLEDLMEWSVELADPTKEKDRVPYYKYFNTLTLCIAWVLSLGLGKPHPIMINRLIIQSVENHRDYYIGTCIETATFPFCAVIRR